MPMKRKKSTKMKASAKRRAKPVPDGYHSVTPHLVLDDCAKAIEFYKKAFGAKEGIRMPGPDGKIAHAEIQVGDSKVMMNDEMPSMPGQPGVYKSPKTAGLATSTLFLYLKDVGAAFDRAIKAGCAPRQPPTDMFWGDRYCQVIDPFGHTWGLATRIEDVRPAQLKKRHQEFLAKIQQSGGGQQA